MALNKEQRLFETLQSNEAIKAIRIITPSQDFAKRFGGSTSKFFRSLKNGLHSINGISNRKFFKDFSGCYFSLVSAKECEIIILYDSALSPLNHLQIKIRIKKLLGLYTTVELGEFSEYNDRIDEMMGVVRKSQAFGSYYLNKCSNKII